MTADDRHASDIRASIIIAAHDSGRHIGPCIQSVLSQSVSDIEIIVVDDASRDDTCDVVRRMQAIDQRLSLVRLDENSGPSVARNKAIDAARGRWVAILDSDDAFSPDRVERLLDRAEAVGADMVSDNPMMFDETSGREIGAMYPARDVPPGLDATAFLLGNLPDESRPRQAFGFFKPMIRRAFLEAQSLRYREDLRFAEDFDLYLRALLSGARWVTSPEALYRYTVRDKSLTARHRAEDLGRLAAAERELTHHPAVERDKDLAGALARHLASTTRRFQVARFAETIEKRDVAEIVRLAASEPRLCGLHAGMLFDRLRARVPSRRATTDRIFGIRFSNATLDDIRDRLVRVGGDAFEGPRTVLTANLDHIVSLRRSGPFRQAYANAWVATVDGMPVLAYARLRGLDVPHRVTGADLFASVMQSLDPATHRCFFVAPTRSCATALVDVLVRRGFPRAALATYVPEAGFEKDAVSSSHLRDAIDAHAPTHVFFGVGSPKSEVWVEQRRAQLPACYVLHVGAALEFQAGSRPRAPVWMRRSGLEWLWRWMREPRRLFARYFIRSWTFPLEVARDLFGSDHQSRA